MINKLLFTALLFVFTSNVFSQVPNYVPTNGLVGYWPFNGNANDVSGNNLNGSVIGATLTADRNGNPNSAYNFDFATVGFGTQTDEVYIPFSPLFNTPSVSISIWVYQRQYVWSGNTNPPFSTIAARFQYGYSNPNGEVWMLNSGTNGCSAFANGPSINLNSWTHIVSTFENGIGKIYINGQLIDTQNNMPPLNIIGNSGISIGESNQANGYYWPTDGVIDDFALFNRALTNCEIQGLYQSLLGNASLSAGANQTVCAGTSVTLNGSGANSYSWNNGVANGIAFTPVSSQTFTVTGTDINGCINSSETTITVNPLPTVNAGIDQSVCAGASVTLSGTGTDTYSWDNSVSNGIGFIPSANSTYTVTGTNTVTGCTNTDQVTVTVNALPTVNAGNDQTVCAGTSATLSGTGADTYSWDNSVSNGIGFIPTTNSTYTVTGTNTATGCANTDHVDVTVNAFPTVNAGNDQTVCAGTTVTLSGTGADTYSWDNSVNNGIGFIPSANTTYTLTGTNTATGCSNTDQVDVTVNALPTVNAGNDQTVCAGTTVTVSGTGADTYSWNNNVSNGIGFIPTANTTYTVTGTNTATGCTNTDQVVVTVNALPTVNAGNDQAVCAGTSVALSGTGADTYSWDNAVIDGILFTPTTNTTFIVTGTNTATGCTNTDQVTVNVNALPTVNAGNDQTICIGDNVILNGSGAATYSWDNVVIDGVSFVPTVTEIYHLQGTDVNGCQGIDSVQVIVNNTSTSTLTETALDSYTLNGQTYTQSGTYSQVIPNAAGCDSTITLNLILNFTGIDEMKNFAVSIYPNPSRDVLFIHSEIELFSSFELIDNQGRIVLSDKLKGNQTSVNMEAIAPGNYYIKIEERNILVKVVKQ